YTIIKNSNAVPIAMMVIDWKFDVSLVNTLKVFIPDNIDLDLKENKNSKSEDIIIESLKKVITTVDKDEVGPSVYNKTIIKKLYAQGVFEFKESVQVVANYLNISHHTVYLHLRSIKRSKKIRK
ncbi:helix-turn-helix domain-containing protein, partial [Brachyspira hampsonii]